jgi:hypothetical protein
MRRHVRVFTAPVARISNSVKRRSGERVAWVSPEKLPDLLQDEALNVFAETALASLGGRPRPLMVSFRAGQAASPAIARAMIASFLSSPDKARTRSLIAAISCAALAGLRLRPVDAARRAQSGSHDRLRRRGGRERCAAAALHPAGDAADPRADGAQRAAQTVIICAMITAAGFVLFPAMPDPVIWFGLRFVMGLVGDDHLRRQRDLDQSARQA